MQVSKWGNSLAVRLPSKLVNEMKLKPGDELVIVRASKEELEVEKLDRESRLRKDLERFQFELPEGYVFDRDEANER